MTDYDLLAQSARDAADMAALRGALILVGLISM